MFHQTCQTVWSITVNIKTILSNFSFQNPEKFINTATFKKVNNKIRGGQSSAAGSAAFSLEQMFPPSLALWHSPPTHIRLTGSCQKLPRLGHSLREDLVRSKSPQLQCWPSKTLILTIKFNIRTFFTESYSHKCCSAVNTHFHGGFLANWFIISRTNAN